MDANAGHIKETNWLRDILPKLLKHDRRQSIYPRVMTYGYNADIWITRSVANIDVPVENLLSYLDTERSEVRTLRLLVSDSLSLIQFRIRVVHCSSLDIVLAGLSLKRHVPLTLCTSEKSIPRASSCLTMS